MEEESASDRFLRELREIRELERTPLFMGDFLEPPEPRDSHYRMGDGIDDENGEPVRLPGRFVIDDDMVDSANHNIHLSMEDLHIDHNWIRGDRSFSINAMNPIQVEHPPRPSISAKVKVKTINGKMVKE